jgi:hypothetical protein
MAVYGSRAASQIPDLIARQGEIAGRSAAQSGMLWARALENVGGIAGQAVMEHQQQKQQEEILKKRQAFVNAALDNWDGNPLSLFKALTPTIGPEKAMEVARGAEIIFRPEPLDWKGASLAVRSARHLYETGGDEAVAKAWPILGKKLGPLGLEAGVEVPTDYSPGFGQNFKVWDDMLNKPAEQRAPERVEQNGQVFERQQDGTWKPAVGLPAEAPKPGTRREAMDATTKRLTFVTDAEIEANPGRYQPIRSGVNVTVAGRGGGGGESPLDKLPQEWRTVVDRASLVMPAARRPAFDAAIGRVAAAGDMGELGAVVRQAAVEGENVDTKNQILGRQATIASLEDTGQILAELKAKGVPTGWLTGTAENLARKLGTTTNPEYVALGNRLMGTLINYRRAATGVAFSARESADYERMFPNYKNELPVNEALIKGLLREMSTYDRAYWEHKLGKKGAELVGALPKEGGGAKPEAGGWVTLPNGIRIREKK